MDGREVTAASARDVRLGIGRLVGRTVTEVEARGKHLLIGFGPGGPEELVLHTHMGMKGSWRVRSAGRPWGRAASQALVVIEAGDHHAGCWAAVIVRLVARHDLELGSLSSLGPDVLVDRLDTEEVMARVRRRRALRPDTTIGELLLDQTVAAGIGNVYRCEALFLRRVWPFLPLDRVDDDSAADLIGLCTSMLRANLGAGAGRGRDTGAGPGRQWVHRRAGLPCRRCGTTVRSADLGRTPRRIYWCPACQAPDPGGVLSGPWR
ncbi:MAG: DNA-formamidopyrimidine glycosylase family protein [Acidimicrobiales bacterium]